MNDNIVEILDKPILVRVAILFGTVALVGAGFWYFMLSAAQEELAQLDTSITELKQQVAEKRAIAANLGKFEDEVQRLDVELNKALRELPDKREIDELLNRISDRARDAGLEIRLFQPAGERPKDFYAEVPVELEVLGSFHQIATFFDELAHLNRIVNVEDYSIGQPSKDAGDIAVQTKAVITSFRFLDESERIPEKSKKKKRRRR